MPLFHDPPARNRVFALLALTSLAGFLLVVLSLGVLSPFDDWGVQALTRWRSPALTPLMQGISWLGSGGAEFPFVVVITGLLFRWQGKRKGLEYFGWSLGGWIAYALLKTLFHRTRPHLVPWLSGGGWYSFPSGHAMLAPIIFVFAAFMMEREVKSPAARRLLLGGAWTLSLLIALSRVYLGVHYPTDALAGLLAGSAWVGLSLVTMSWRDRVRQESAGEKVVAGKTSPRPSTLY